MTGHRELFELFRSRTGKTTITPPPNPPADESAAHGHQRSRDVVLTKHDIFMRYWKPMKGRDGD